MSEPLPQGAGHRVEQSLSVAALALMAVLPLVEILARETMGGGIAGSIPFVQHLTLVVTFLGAALAAQSDRMLAMSTGEFLPKPAAAAAKVFAYAMAAGITVALAWASWELVSVEREAGETIAWGLPTWAVLLVMPVGFAAIALRMVWRSADAWLGRILAALGLLIPVAFGWWEWMGTFNVVTPGIAVILLATLLGMPIYAAIGGATLLLLWYDMAPLASLTTETYRLASSPMLPAIPLFTISGYLLAEGGASKRLLRLFEAWVGWMPGGMAVVTALTLAFFTPLTGASGVTILSIGGLLLPVLVKASYPERTSVGLVTVSGSIGLLFPPSLPVILYAFYANQEIEDLFIGGLIPGFLLVGVVAVWAGHRGWTNGARTHPFNLAEARASLWDAKWELLLPIVVLGGIFGGFTTLVEASAVTVLYAFFVECFVYRDLSFRRDVPRILVECATLVGGFMIILSVALGFTSYLIFEQVPDQAFEWVQGHIESQWAFLLALNVFLIICGALMDIYSAIIVVVPLITPMAAAYGIDPVHLGIVFLANMELGYLMPPMGENLFLSSFRFEKSLFEVYRSVLPYMLMLLIAVLLITYIPALTLFAIR